MHALSLSRLKAPAPSRREPNRKFPFILVFFHRTHVKKGSAFGVGIFPHQLQNLFNYKILNSSNIVMIHGVYFIVSRQILCVSENL